MRLHRALLGYRPSSVNRLLEEVRESFEEVWREREELRDAVEQLEAELARLARTVVRRARLGGA